MDENGKTEEEDLMGLCICPNCPSYVSCGELAFCLDKVGNSKCIADENGCMCPGCPVAIQLKLTRDYFCIRGSEKEQLRLHDVNEEPGNKTDTPEMKTEEDHK